MKKYIKLAVPIVLALVAIYACNKLSAPEIPAVSGNNPMYVSMDEAESMLLEIMDRMEAVGTKSSDDGSARRTISGRYSMSFSDATKSGDEAPVVHVFNFEDESGFAIMSGDKRITPLLAYTFKGSLEEGKPIENPGLALYMAGLENMISGVVLDTLMAVDTVPQFFLDMEIYDMINGPCPVKWNQTHPYNYYCEEYSGGKLLTGCVATAVAQLMACYRYPDSYKEYTFDWDAMIEASNEPYVPEVPEVPKDTFVMANNDNWDPNKEPDSAMLQVARLMQQLGLEENLANFTIGDSTSVYATDEHIVRTLENFGYLPGMQRVMVSSGDPYISREENDFFSNNKGKVIDELKNGYYCTMSGSMREPYNNKENWLLHCWIVHGLMSINFSNDLTKYYYKCNFGWGGYADGYYLENVFNSYNGPNYKEHNVKAGNNTDYSEITFWHVIGIRNKE